MKYSYSWDEERFEGEYDSPEEAAAVAFAEEEDGGIVYVGRNVAPTTPEQFIAGDLLIEHVQAQDEYCEDWADGWPRASKAQIEELTTEIRKTFGAWVDRHNLRPRFWTVENVQRIERPFGE